MPTHNAHKVEGFYATCVSRISFICPLKVPLIFISWVPNAPPKASDVIVCEEVVQDDIAAVPHKTGKRRTVSMPHVVRNN
mmetsp:Transcript_9628/g.15478  ORF Transcript_9628/g.15478 Transcript_9628/m.15478 type:complete len:80 (-) Transcript_9628:169-408(-)